MSKHIEVPDHVKEKILLFFLEKSVPKIIEARRKEAEENDKRNDRDARTI